MKNTPISIIKIHNPRDWSKFSTDVPSSFIANNEDKWNHMCIVVATSFLPSISIDTLLSVCTILLNWTNFYSRYWEQRWINYFHMSAFWLTDGGFNWLLLEFIYNTKYRFRVRVFKYKPTKWKQGYIKNFSASNKSHARLNNSLLASSNNRLAVFK
jgi:hypothetical protein